ncbi:hypothetical protein ACFQI7_24225 [Paenibacillus allorhizosphaerae]|uniref:Uncharacterized protein n=1 Tax=Paenibacillus allorhizosphaerae TaxID=2849866 RepID=A0ABM8VKC0_9BACL|nr:hypothetical protein [Paenibacillus allorhizosphaerae]CAG7646838.1 hypothetical protein PAECIP111802_03844 [Paenibacillus allorhizosphaerae]
MNLIDLYIHEVTRRLPEKNRADIALELRSTIEDMLPDEYSEQDIKSTLSKLGNPAILANGYLDRPMHLIGPRFYDLYIQLLKMILPVSIAISIVSVIANRVIAYDGSEAVLNVILDTIGHGIWSILSGAIQVFFWLTIVFAFLERTSHPKANITCTSHFKEWEPDDLNKIPFIPKEKAISKGEVFGSLLWTAIWASVYFNAAHLVGVYEKGQDGLIFVTPTFNQEVLLSYWPLVVIVIGLEAASAIYKWTTAQWTRKVALLNAAFHLVSSIIFIVVISDSRLFNTAFVSYMTDLFTMTDETKNGIYGLVVFIFVIFAVIDAYQGFRKANGHRNKKLNL